MTQEDRQLLLKDLCARLPYGVIVYNPNPAGGEWDELISMDIPTGTVTLLYDGCTYKVEKIKPYLRPISSLNKREKESLRAELSKDTALYAAVVRRIADGDETASGTAILHFAEDWCNANHIDYRGMIEKGLAIEAPKDMYKTE